MLSYSRMGSVGLLNARAQLSRSYSSSLSPAGSLFCDIEQLCECLCVQERWGAGLALDGRAGQLTNAINQLSAPIWPAFALFLCRFCLFLACHSCTSLGMSMAELQV
jgi:hypothetical protein